MRMRAVFVDRDSLPMTANPQMRGHALAFVKDLDRCRCRAHLHQHVNQVVRHAVIVRIEGYVVVDVLCGRPHTWIISWPAI